MKAYLSGGIEFAEKYGKEWRVEIEEWLRINLNHEVFNPVKESISFFAKRFPEFNRQYLKQETEEKIRTIIGELAKYECNEIIKNTDYIICLWDESCMKGAGTQGELTIAKFYDIPVYIVSSMDLLKIPSWIIGCSTNIFKDFENLKDFLNKKF